MRTVQSTAARGRYFRTWTTSTASVIALLSAAASGNQAFAQAAAAAPSVEEEIVVTGSRVVRDGYEAPTPVTVVGAEQIEAAALPNIADYVNQMPAFGAAQNTRDGGSGVTGGRIAENNLNLRGLGSERTLTLLDGHRIVGASTAGTANINDFPQNLITRVDVVTGGASSAYGSDALAGVTNFVLDREYIGVKGNIQGSITTYGDNPTVNGSLAAGTAFASGRGHLLLSAEYSRVPGVHPMSKRAWNLNTTKILANPAYVAGNGQPQFLLRSNVGNILTAPGGVVVSGPLKGITFDKQGNPFQYPYGTLTSNPYTVYPEGQTAFSDPTRYGQSLEDGLVRTATFARLSYDVSDNINVYAQFLNSYSHAESNVQMDESYNGSPASPIFLDNAYLPAAVRTMMVGAGVTSILIGSYNQDLPWKTGDFVRRVWSYAVGANGTFDALNTEWSWDVQAQFGINRARFETYVMKRPMMINATDAVRTANGSIACRINVDADPANNDPGCVPWNMFGWGNNGQAAVDYIKGRVNLVQRLKQDVYAFSFSGEPFSTWAGPVSIATGAEHRSEGVRGVGDPLAALGYYNTANYLPAIGSYKVTEGFLETVVPLATDTSWAQSLELNGAVRATDYSNSGYVTTWKIGATYQPIDDIRFRVTRSKDIRAPNLGNLFAGATTSRSSGFTDPFRGNATQNGIPSASGGNTALVPEVAATIGVGMVLQPSFLPGIQGSIDMYDISIDNAISTVSVQDAVNLCFDGRTNFCSQITRDAAGNIIRVSTAPINFLKLETRGIDIELSYRTSLSDWSDSLDGDLTLRALTTHVMHLRSDTGFSFVTDAAGDHTIDGSGTPRWRYNLSLAYSLDPFRFTWTGRGLTSGHYQSNYITCASACPTATASNPTIDNSYIEGRFYHDVSFNYAFLRGEQTGSEMEAFMSISNLLNTDPPRVALPSYFHGSTNPRLYDTLGRVFRAGVRFKM